MRILQPDEWLRPDMSVRVTFFAGEPAGGVASAAPQVLAPREAVRRDDQGEYAWVVTEGRLRRQEVASAGEAATAARSSRAGSRAARRSCVGEAGACPKGSA